MYGLNFGNVGQALKLTGSNYQLPEDVVGTTTQRTPPPVQPDQANAALEATGSDYRVPGAADQLQQASGAVDALPESGSGQADGDGTKYPGLKNSPAAGLVKKAASAVAAFYTGGLSAAAMNVGGQVLSKNNPQAGAAAQGAMKLFGG